jgi:hypothetical protein
MAQHGDLEQLLDLNGGLVKVSNFLPPHVADGILSTLQQLPERVWNDTSAQQDYAHNNIDHSFMSVKTVPQLEAAFRAFTLLLPDSLHTFSAARYTSRDHIAPHDDRAYTQVRVAQERRPCTVAAAAAAARGSGDTSQATHG